jgi:short-subunit dehydrogenase
MTLMAARSPPPSAFLGKKVWITGASQGLGAELAKQFAAQGDILILSARNKARLEVSS